MCGACAQGTTVFLPGTHTGSKGPRNAARRAFDEGVFDADARDKMLAESESRYTLLKKVRTAEVLIGVRPGATPPRACHLHAGFTTP